MLYTARTRLTLARSAASGMESSLQEAKQTLTHFWAYGRASKLQCTEEQPERQQLGLATSSNAEQTLVELPVKGHRHDAQRVGLKRPEVSWVER